MTERIGFEAVVEDGARVLILGTLPGEESLRCAEYYANKRNAFWWIMGKLVGASPDMPYQARLSRIKDSRIALWDVCAAATRQASLDANIVAPTVNDFASFLDTHRRIELICFNGQKAEKLYCTMVLPNLPPSACTIRRQALPSTSGAHAVALEKKLLRWHEIISQVVGVKPC